MSGTAIRVAATCLGLCVQYRSAAKLLQYQPTRYVVLRSGMVLPGLSRCREEELKDPESPTLGTAVPYRPTHLLRTDIRHATRLPSDLWY
eukprot:1563127-Rhodomonas_salina.1